MELSPAVTLWLVCGSLSAAYLPGLVALLMPPRLLSPAITAAVSAGLLLGAGLCVILPEGFHTLAEAQEGPPVSQQVPPWAAGAALLSGFLLMMSLDALRPSHASHEEGCPGHMHHHSHEVLDGDGTPNHHHVHEHSLHSPLLAGQAREEHAGGAHAEPPGQVLPAASLEGPADTNTPSNHSSSNSVFATATLQMQLQEQFPAAPVADGCRADHPHHHHLQQQQQQQQRGHLSLEVPGTTKQPLLQPQQHMSLDTPGGGSVRHRYYSGSGAGSQAKMHGLPVAPLLTPRPVRLPSRKLSRQTSAPMCYHPPHPFPPPECLLLPACSWQPPQVDEECVREVAIDGSETESDEEHASLLHDAIQEVAEEGESSFSGGSSGQLGNGHVHGHNEADHGTWQDHHHHHQHRHLHQHGAAGQLKPAQIAIVIPDGDGLQPGLLTADHTTALLTPAGISLIPPAPHHDHHHHHHHHHGPLTRRRSMAAHHPPRVVKPLPSKLRDARQALIGLVIHSCADGLAVGAAALSNDLAVSLSIALSIMVHKMPVAYGLAAFLKAAGCSWQVANEGLLAFVAAAPLTALTTYYLLGSLTPTANPQVVALFLLASGGTVLHAGAVHVLPSAGTRLTSLAVLSLCCCVPLLVSALVEEE